MKLSIGMMVKNESKYLERCLQSLQPIRDAVDSELIIVDTGSTDNTVEIAKKFTDKVYFHPWNNNFSQMRNITISYAKGEWFFCIDADEILDNPKGIINFFNTNICDKYNTGSLIVKNLTDENDDTSFSLFSSNRLFRKDKDFHYEGVIHNNPVYKLPVVDIDCTLIHYGYMSTDKELMERKFKRTSTILISELNKNPNNIYYLYQLSVSYSMHNDNDKAIQPIEKAYNLLKQNKADPHEYMYVYTHIALIYLKNKMYEKAEQICKEAILVSREYIDLYFYIAQAQCVLQKNKDAIENYMHYLKLVDEYNDSTISRDKSIIHYTLGKYEDTYYNLTILCNKTDQYDSAIKYGSKIKSPRLLKPILSEIIYAYLKTSDYKGLHRYYKDKLLKEKPELKEKFITALESRSSIVNEDDKKMLYKAFSKDDDIYSILNRIRIEDINDKDLYDVTKTDFNSLPEFYGDIIYYLLKKQKSLDSVLWNLRDSNITCFMQYLSVKYKDFSETVYDYLKQSEPDDISSIRINKALERCALVLDTLPDDKYRYVFQKYIKEGTYYISKIYSSEVIQNQAVHELKNDEEEFLLYMYHADACKKQDQKKYIEYLRKALDAYPYMNRGIKFLMDDIRKETDTADKKLDEYKSKLKKNLNILIDAGRLKEAKSLINEYETIVPNDVEAISAKAVIAIMENRLTDARDILLSGLNIYIDDFDLNYNLAYVYEKTEEFDNALRYYKEAEKHCSKDDMKLQIRETMKNIIKDHKVTLACDRKRIAFFVK